MSDEKKYDVSLTFEKFPAYVIEKLVNTGLYGRSRESVVEEIVLSWMREHSFELEKFEITIEDARAKGYLNFIKD